MKNINRRFAAVLILIASPFFLYGQADSIPTDQEALRFFVVGDWGRNGQHNQKEVADQMGRTADYFKPEFIISTGDNFYCCGVAGTNDPQWDSSFENIYTAHSLHVPWMPVLGNHDYMGNTQAQIDYSSISRRWQMPARYYAVNAKGVTIIFLDTNPFIKSYHRVPGHPDIARQDTSAQLRWLDSTLAASQSKTKIVVGHHPLYSSGWHGNNKDVVEKILPRLEKYNVAIYFSGHDHHLEHIKTDGQKTHHIVSGAGSQLRAVKGKGKRSKFAKSVAGFAAVSIKEKDIKIYFVDEKGKVVYLIDL